MYIIMYMSVPGARPYIVYYTDSKEDAENHIIERKRWGFKGNHAILEVIQSEDYFINKLDKLYKIDNDIAERRHNVLCDWSRPGNWA